MNVCLNVFRSNSSEAERCGVDTEKLFADMRTVVNVSKSLVKLLDNYANNRPYVDQRVGVCFLDLKFEIKDAYTKYCRNHDSTNMLLRSYEGESAPRALNGHPTHILTGCAMLAGWLAALILIL